MNDQPANPPGFKARFLLIPSGLILAVALGLYFSRRPTPSPPPLAMPVAPLVELNRTNFMRFHGLWCQFGQTNPFTGVMVETYPGGQPMSRSVISNGLLNGLSEGWFTNGQMQVQETYRNNLSDGLRTKWYPNGHKLSEATIVQGKIEGVFRHWHIDGSLAEEIPIRAGEQEGVGRSWYPSGYLQEEVEVRGGKVVRKQIYQPDDRKKTGE